MACLTTKSDETLVRYLKPWPVFFVFQTETPTIIINFNSLTTIPSLDFGLGFALHTGIRGIYEIDHYATLRRSHSVSDSVYIYGR
jgi:hypothetical protein